MARKKKVETNKALPPTNDLVNVQDTIKRLNQKLVDAKSGNYLIVIKDISDFYRLHSSYEYYSNVTIHFVDMNNAKRMEGVKVPGLGNKPIELNKNKRLHTTSFVDWITFEDQLFEKASMWQDTINNEGHY